MLSNPFTPAIQMTEFAIAMTAGHPLHKRDHSYSVRRLEQLKRDAARWDRKQASPDSVPSEETT